MSEATHETFATSTVQHTFDHVTQGREGSNHHDGHTYVHEESEVQSPLQPSIIRSIVLIFTCTVAMVVNVCALLTSILQRPINFFL